MAKIEFSVLVRQCLDRRIPDLKTLRGHIAPWQNERNRNVTTVDWRFTITDARVNLNRLYPS